MMTNNLESVETKLEPVTLDLNFGDQYQDFKSDAYKRLMMDAAAGDASLYIHRDEVDNAWAWVDPIIEHWQKPDSAPEPYTAGSWGPEAADKLLSDDNRIWFNAGQNSKRA
jgi:glucose-6-phosphate 1-dehydrogenase